MNERAIEGFVEDCTLIQLETSHSIKRQEIFNSNLVNTTTIRVLPRHAQTFTPEAMDRTRRSAKVKAHAGFAELRRLREEGKTRLSTYEVEKKEDLYDEVDEEQYKKVVRDRLDQDDFVVDDGGEGYVDNGLEDWSGEDERRYYSSDGEERGEDGRKITKKELKRKRDEEQERRARQENDIQKYFGRKEAPAVKAVKATVSTAKDREILDDLLGEFDTSASFTGLSSPMKRFKVEPPVAARRRTRKASPPRKRVAPIDFGKTMRSSPPLIDGPESDYGDDVTFPPEMDDDVDTPMGDAQNPPSSPSAMVSGRKLHNNDDDDDDDDELKGAEIKADGPFDRNEAGLGMLEPAVDGFGR